MRRRDFTKLAAGGGSRDGGGAGGGARPDDLQLEDDELLRSERRVLFDRPGQREGPLSSASTTMSGGRLKIQFYGAGELIPAAEGFDAVSSGTSR